MGEFDGALVEQAAELLMFLESIDWKWDIATILEQPNELTKAVMRLRVIGNKLQKEAEKSERMRENGF